MYLWTLYKMSKWIHQWVKHHRMFSSALFTSAVFKYKAPSLIKLQCIKLSQNEKRDFWFVFTSLNPWEVTGLTDPDYTCFLKLCSQKDQNRIIEVTTPESFLWVREFQDTRPLGFLFLPLLSACRGRPWGGFPVHRVHLCGSCAVSSCSKMMAVQSLMLQVHLELMGASVTFTLNGYSSLNPWLCSHIFTCKRILRLQDRGSHPLGEEKDQMQVAILLFDLFYFPLFVSLGLSPFMWKLCSWLGNSPAGLIFLQLVFYPSFPVPTPAPRPGFSWQALIFSR